MDRADRAVLREHIPHRVRIADVRLHEIVIRVASHAVERVEVARVRELVDVHDAKTMLVHEATNDGRAYEAGTSGYDDLRFLVGHRAGRGEASANISPSASA